MSKTVKTKITTTSDGDGVESEWTVPEMENPAGPSGGPVKYLLATGPNDLVVPTGAYGMVIKPPASSTAVLKLKGGSGGGTGFALRTGYAAALPLPTGTAVVHVDSSLQELVDIQWT